MTAALHIIKSTSPDHHPWDVLAHLPPERAGVVVLIHDAVGAPAGCPVPAYALASDAERRGVRPAYPVIDDARLLEMIWEADTVTVW